MSNTIPSNTPATLHVHVQLTVLVPVPANALTNDSIIADATAHIQDIVYNAFSDYNTTLTTITPESIAINDDVCTIYDLDM